MARAVERMGLRHVVVTSVDRDDLPDSGAGHFAATIRAIRRRSPECGIEVLVPDFLGFRDGRCGPCWRRRRTSSTTTSRRRAVLPAGAAQGRLPQALELLDRAKDVWAELHPDRPPLLTKSGIIVGMGETDEEVGRGDARPARPPRGHRDHRPVPPADERHLPLDRWVTPEQFAGLRAPARSWASRRCSPGRWCGRATTRTSRRPRRPWRRSDERRARGADGEGPGGLARPARAGS